MVGMGMSWVRLAGYNQSVRADGRDIGWGRDALKLRAVGCRLSAFDERLCSLQERNTKESKKIEE